MHDNAWINKVQRYLDVLVRIDRKSVSLRTALSNALGNKRAKNETEIIRLYFELGRLVDEALSCRVDFRGRTHLHPPAPDEAQNRDEETEDPTTPPDVSSIKQLMGMGESLGFNLVRLVDTRQFAKAQSECLRMCRAIEGFASKRRHS